MINKERRIAKKNCDKSGITNELTIMLWFNVKPLTFRLIHYFYIACALYLLCGFLRYFVLLYCKCRNCCTTNCCTTSCCTTNCCAKAHSVQCSCSDGAKVRRSDSRRSMRRQNSMGFQSKRTRFVQVASTLMAFLSITAGVVTFAHILLDLWVFSVNSMFSINMLCVRQKWSGIMLFWNFLCVYLFLWIRQRVFYSHPVLRSLSNPIVNRFSWSVLFAIVLSITTFAIVYYVMPGDYEVNPEKINNREYFVFYNASTWRVFSIKHHVSWIFIILISKIEILLLMLIVVEKQAVCETCQLQKGLAVSVSNVITLT